MMSVSTFLIISLLAFLQVVNNQFTNKQFFLNVTTLRSGICHRKSVCRRRLSVTLLSETFVHPTQPVGIFGNISTPFCIPATR